MPRVGDVPIGPLPTGDYFFMALPSLIPVRIHGSCFHGGLKRSLKRSVRALRNFRFYFAMISV